VLISSPFHGNDHDNRIHGVGLPTVFVPLVKLENNLNLSLLSPTLKDYMPEVV
jgi:hypothetical protein